MLVDCPECGASLEGSSGTEMVCPACMSPFLVPSAARAVRAFDVQTGGDAAIQRMSRYAIREAIYLGRLTAAARVRHDGTRWELIGGYPEFAAVFRLLGGDLAPMAGTRKLAGWGRSDASSPRHNRPGAAARTAETTLVPAQPAELAPPAPWATPYDSADSSGSTPIPAEEAPPAPPPARQPAPPARAPRLPGEARAPAPTAASGSRVYILGGLLVVGLVVLGFLLT